MEEHKTYKKKDLVLAAKEQGFDVTQRMIDDWVSTGLLDAPTRKGLGRGKGVVATWPENQCQLFLSLLKKRKELKKLITPLYNIPVWVWLEYGDTHVPLRQVKRTLVSWTRVHGYTSNTWTRARVSARGLLDFMKHPNATRQDRNELVEIVARANYTGKYDLVELRKVVEKVFDPDGVGRARGPHGAQVTVDSLMSLIEARVSTLARIENITDDEFLAARDNYLQATNLYWRELPRFASDPDMGDFFEVNNVEERLNSACMSLITMIGIQSQSRPQPKGGENNG